MSAIGRPKTDSKLAVAFVAFAGLTGAAEQLPETRLADITSHPLAFEHKTVRTCGWASNAFENVMITTARNMPYDKAVGLGMEWCPGAPRLEETYTCVTGVVQGLAGQDGRDIVAGRGAVISTGSPFQWELVQQCPAK